MGRKRSNNKAIAQMKHAIRRMEERFGIVLKQHQYDHLTAEIRRGLARRIGRETTRISHFWIEVEGHNVGAVYDKQRKKIVTFLPIDWSIHRVNEARKDRAKFVVLRGRRDGNRFWSTNEPGNDPRYSAEGEHWYDIIGYADSPKEALLTINRDFILNGGLCGSASGPEGEMCSEFVPEHSDLQD